MTKHETSVMLAHFVDHSVKTLTGIWARLDLLKDPEFGNILVKVDSARSEMMSVQDELDKIIEKEAISVQGAYNPYWSYADIDEVC